MEIRQKNHYCYAEFIAGIVYQLIRSQTIRLSKLDCHRQIKREWSINLGQNMDEKNCGVFRKKNLRKSVGRDMLWMIEMGPSASAVLQHRCLTLTSIHLA